MLWGFPFLGILGRFVSEDVQGVSIICLVDQSGWSDDGDNDNYEEGQEEAPSEEEEEKDGDKEEEEGGEEEGGEQSGEECWDVGAQHDIIGKLVLYLINQLLTNLEQNWTMMVQAVITATRNVNVILVGPATAAKVI